MSQPMTLADLNKLAAHSAELKERGVLSIGIDYRGTAVHVTPETLADLTSLLGQQPEKRAHGTGDYWRCAIQCGDLELFALLHPHELPMIGYPEEPLPPKEEAEAEAAALQAS